MKKMAASFFLLQKYLIKEADSEPDVLMKQDPAWYYAQEHQGCRFHWRQQSDPISCVRHAWRPVIKTRKKQPSLRYCLFCSKNMKTFYKLRRGRLDAS